MGTGRWETALERCRPNALHGGVVVLLCMAEMQGGSQGEADAQAVCARWRCQARGGSLVAGGSTVGQTALQASQSRLHPAHTVVASRFRELPQPQGAKVQEAASRPECERELVVGGGERWCVAPRHLDHFRRDAGVVDHLENLLPKIMSDKRS